MKSKTYVNGTKYILDAEFNNGSIVTLISHGNIYGKVKGDESEWETMLNRLTEIPEWAKPYIASQFQHPAPPSGEDAGKGWISVEDKTPIAYKTGVWDGQKSDLVLTYNAVDDTHCIATLYEGYLDGNHFKDWYHVDDFEIPTPTHWKPLTAPNP